MKLSCTSFFRASSSSSGKQSSRFRSATRARDFSLLHRKWPSRSPSFCLDDMGKKDKRYSRNTIAHDGHKRGCQRGVFLYLDDLAILPCPQKFGDEPDTLSSQGVVDTPNNYKSEVI